MYSNTGFIKWWLPCLLLMACAACKRDKVGVVVEQTAAPVPVAVAKAGIPSEAEIAAFIEAWQDPEDANKSVRFDVTFGPARLIPPIMGEFRERGKIPFTVSVNFYRQENEPMLSPWGRRISHTETPCGRFETLGWSGASDAQPQLMRVLQMVNIYSIMEGEAEIAILDADGKVVDRTRKALGLLCPS